MPTRRSALISPHAQLAKLGLLAHIRRALTLRPGRLPPQILSSQGWMGMVPDAASDKDGGFVIGVAHADGTRVYFRLSLTEIKQPQEGKDA
jgi:hypothetical protein